jgi:hypothetical protein
LTTVHDAVREELDLVLDVLPYRVSSALRQRVWYDYSLKYGLEISQRVKKCTIYCLRAWNKSLPFLRLHIY